MENTRGSPPLLATPIADRIRDMAWRGIAEEMSLAEGRAFLLFRGMRGVLGVPWMAKQLMQEQARSKRSPSGACPPLGCGSVLFSDQLQVLGGETPQS